MAIGQIVTSSFERSFLSINPATSALRNYTQIGVTDTFQASASEMTEKKSDGLDWRWEEELDLNRMSFYFTTNSVVAVEGFLSSDYGTKDQRIQIRNGDTHTAKKSFNTKGFSLGYKLNEAWSFGFKMYSNKYNLKESYSVFYWNKFNYSAQTYYVEKLKNDVLAYGPGLTYRILGDLYVGTYFTKIDEDYNFYSYFQDLDSSTKVKASAKKDFRSQYGVGLSYLQGDRGGGLRFEGAYSKMKHSSYRSLGTGEEMYLAMEYSGTSIATGVNFKFRKNGYFEQNETMEHLLGNQVYAKKFVPRIGYFISGSSKGNTIGFTVVNVGTSGEKIFQGHRQFATTNYTEFGFSYAFIF